MRRFNVTNSESGFTLLEQLIVLVLVGILGALSAPSFMGMKQRSELNDAVSSLRSSLQEAQRQAIMKSETCTITLPADDTPNPNITSTPPECLVFGSSTLSKVKIFHNYEDANPDNEIKFNFKGQNTTIDDTSPTTDENDPNVKFLEGLIRLEHKDNSSLGQKCIKISDPLGLVRVGDYDGTNCVAAQ